MQQSGNRINERLNCRVERTQWFHRILIKMVEPLRLFHIWTHPVLQDTVSFVTRKRLQPYIRPVIADVLPLALMNSARLDLNNLSASHEPLD
jgi:hypothetical protein